MNEWTNDWANKQRNEGTSEPINEWVNEWCKIEIKQLELEDDDFQGSHSEVLLVAFSFQGCMCQNWSLFIGRVNYPTISHSPNATWGPLSFVSKSLPLQFVTGQILTLHRGLIMKHIAITLELLLPRKLTHRPLKYEIVGDKKTSYEFFVRKIMVSFWGWRIGSFCAESPGSESAGLTNVTSNELELSGNKRGGTTRGDVGKFEPMNEQQNEMNSHF